MKVRKRMKTEKKDLIISDPITVMFGSSSYLK